jgi:hypothetical protein
MKVSHLRFNEGVHPDVIQVPVDPIDNMIVYNLKAIDVQSQGITLGSYALPFKNCALVNCLLDKVATDPQLQWIGGGSTTDHYLIWNCTWNNYGVNFNTNNITNFSIRNCVIPWKTDTSSLTFPGWVAENNHVVDGRYLFGASCSSGNPMFVNPSGGDFHPGSGSPLRSRVTSLPVPADVEGRPITATPAAIGALQPQ